jgi:excisionase family DNA binding protein
MARKRGKGGNGGGTPPAAEELLTVQQVAENWQVSPRTVRRMIADRRLPVRRLGRAVRISANVSAR